MPDHPIPLRLNLDHHGDPDVAELLSEAATVRRWIDVEVALAATQADLGVVAHDHAEAIRVAAQSFEVDRELLWRETEIVGYPILPLIGQFAAHLPEEVAGSLHLGATTQDIMDTALATQLREVTDVLLRRVDALGDALAEQIERYAGAVMVGRTHGQVAVPTTFGAKLATYLAECLRHTERLRRVRDQVAVVSLAGAGGTAAGYGPHAKVIREGVARRLGLAVPIAPWHVSRDVPAEACLAFTLAAATCTRLGREVVELSRDEIGELGEARGRHRGASSTMPQKHNPVLAESIIGLGVGSGASAAAILRWMEAGHERAAGEWHVEWDALPMVAYAAGGALRRSEQLVRSWVVDVERMSANAQRFAVELVAERCMLLAAGKLGRVRAHDLLYDALRAPGERRQQVRETLAVQGVAVPDDLFDPSAYTGEATEIARQVVASWRERGGPVS